MKAVQHSFTKRKLQDLGRELYLEHGWRMPRGFVRSEETNPRNYSLAEWQQAKRAGKDPDRLKAMFQDCWAISDSQGSFAHALRELGYILARGLSEISCVGHDDASGGDIAWHAGRSL
jgi:hypothetical protein